MWISDCWVLLFIFKKPGHALLGRSFTNEQSYLLSQLYSVHFTVTALLKRKVQPVIDIGEKLCCEVLRAGGHHKISELMETVARKLRGYWNYYGITGNYYSLQLYYNFVIRTVHKWLNRRSGRKSYNWKGINELFEAFNIPKPKVKPWL